MIETMIFDLDGTLVQTERLKALSYARAAVELCPHEITEKEVVNAFKDVVGLTRKEVATHLVERFQLRETSSRRMDEFGVTRPWQAFVQIRLNYYHDMLDDPEVIRGNQWAHNMELLDLSRQNGCKVGLATMSRCQQATRVIDILGLKEAFDFVATRDDVKDGKPDPEIYHLVASELATPAENCLVIEDSPSGVKAALNAGMHCIAVTTPFTARAIHEADLLQEPWIVDDPSHLITRVEKMFQRHA